MDVAGQQLTATTAPNCGAAALDRLCGFLADMRVLLVDERGRWDTATIRDAAGLGLQMTALGALSSAYEKGSALAEVVAHTYFLKADAKTGSSQLMLYDGHLTDSPLVDNVVGLRFEYFGDPVPPALLPEADLAATGPWTTYGPRPPPMDRDDPDDSWGPGENCAFMVVDGRQQPRLPVLGATGSSIELPATMLTDGPWCPDAAIERRFDADLLRIRRVRVTLRVQAGMASLRGGAGSLFARGGNATRAERLVPDQEITFDVSPRNLDVAR
jgi:hypothetical protein